jgi:hypothetical protein
MKPPPQGGVNVGALVAAEAAAEAELPTRPAFP